MQLLSLILKGFPPSKWFNFTVLMDFKGNLAAANVFFLSFLIHWNIKNPALISVPCGCFLRSNFLTVWEFQMAGVTLAETHRHDRVAEKLNVVRSRPGRVNMTNTVPYLKVKILAGHIRICLNRVDTVTHRHQRPSNQRPNFQPRRIDKSFGPKAFTKLNTRLAEYMQTKALLLILSVLHPEEKKTSKPSQNGLTQKKAIIRLIHSTMTRQLVVPSVDYESPTPHTNLFQRFWLRFHPIPSFLQVSRHNHELKPSDFPNPIRRFRCGDKPRTPCWSWIKTLAHSGGH